jgi:hypothetical protein
VSTSLQNAAHLDMRIAAYLHRHCASILEDIKRKHFNNGEIFRTILAKTAVISELVIPHDLVLESQNYFLAWKTAQKTLVFGGVLESRDSFGHFADSTVTIDTIARLSPNASDPIDALMKSSQIYLEQQWPAHLSLLNSLEQEAINWGDKPTLSQQVVIIAALAQILVKDRGQLRNFHTSRLAQLLASCTQLKGREFYNKVTRYFEEFKQAQQRLTQLWYLCEDADLYPGDAEELIDQHLSKKWLAIDYKLVALPAEFFNEILKNPNVVNGLNKILPDLKRHQKMVRNLVDLGVEFNTKNLIRLFETDLFKYIKQFIKDGIKSLEFYNVLLSSEFKNLDHELNQYLATLNRSSDSEEEVLKLRNASDSILKKSIVDPVDLSQVNHRFFDNQKSSLSPDKDEDNNLGKVRLP